MKLEAEFATAVTCHFACLSCALDSELQSVAEHNYDPSVKLLLFEYDSPHFSEDFTVVVWPVGSAGRVVGAGRWLLKDGTVAVPAEIYWDGKYEEIEPWGVASSLMEGWIAERWKKFAECCGTISEYIGHHDSHFKTNLQDCSRTSWPEILEKHRC